MFNKLISSILNPTGNHCQVCFSRFNHGEVTTVGVLPGGSHRLVGECCADSLTQVIDRRVYAFVTEPENQLDGLFSGAKGALGHISPDNKTFSGLLVSQEKAPERSPNAGRYTDVEIISQARIVPKSEWPTAVRREVERTYARFGDGGKIAYVVWPDGIVCICCYSRSLSRPSDELLISDYRRVAGQGRVNRHSPPATIEVSTPDDSQTRAPEEVACPGCDQISQEFQVIGAGFNEHGDSIGFGLCRRCSAEFYQESAREGLVSRATGRVNARPDRYGHPAFLQQLLANNNCVEGVQ